MRPWPSNHHHHPQQLRAGRGQRCIVKVDGGVGVCGIHGAVGQILKTQPLTMDPADPSFSPRFCGNTREACAIVIVGLAVKFWAISAMEISVFFFSLERSSVNSVWKSPPWSYCPPVSRKRPTGALPSRQSRHLHTAWRNCATVTAYGQGEKSVSMVFSKGAVYLFIYIYI